MTTRDEETKSFLEQLEIAAKTLEAMRAILVWLAQPDEED